MMQNNNKSLTVIGLTGGIGTGKSTVLDIIRNDYNAYCVEADKIAADMEKKGRHVYDCIVEHFGTQILREDGEIDRDSLRRMAMNAPEALEWLNNLIHPEVKKFIVTDIERVREEAHFTYYVIEAALLIQDGYKDICDYMLNVSVTRKIRIERIMANRGYDYDKALSFINNQPDEDFYRDNSDITIDNSGGREDIAREVSGVFKIIENR